MTDTVKAGGSWMQTFSGRRFDPIRPCAGDIEITDIAHALANLCRFNGHCASFYSVAQHSVHLARAAAQQSGDLTTTRWALLHDAAEAYLPDLVRPLKQGSSVLAEEFRTLEDRILGAVSLRFGLPPNVPLLVKQLDDAILADEARDLMGDPADWIFRAPPLGVSIVPWRPDEAESAFLSIFDDLWLGIRANGG